MCDQGDEVVGGRCRMFEFFLEKLRSQLAQKAGCRGRRYIAQERFGGEDSEGVGGGPAYQREHHGGSREQTRALPRDLMRFEAV
jgi:hypothetical protein